MENTDLITKNTNGNKRTHRNIMEIEFYCDGHHVHISLDNLRENFRKARTAGIRAETKDGELRKHTIDQINQIFDTETVENLSIVRDLTPETKITIRSTPKLKI